MEHGLSFLEFKNRVDVKPTRFHRVQHPDYLRFHVPSQANTVSIGSQEIQPMTSQCIVVYEQNGVMFGKLIIWLRLF